MKKWIALALAMLLLTGCSAQPEHTAPTTEATVPAPTGLYEPGTPVEVQTAGAVRSYPLGSGDYYDLAMLGDRVLLLSGEGNTRLELYSGDEGYAAGELVLPVDLRQTAWQLTETGIVYYEPQTRQAVYLDTQLQEIHRLTLPDELQGLPAFSSDGTEVYYCVGQEIRGVDTQRGISRLIKSHTCHSQNLSGAYFDGELLLCTVENPEGVESSLYVASENGATRSTDQGITALWTYEDRYFVRRMDGVTVQYITAAGDSAPTQLNVSDANVEAALPLGGAVGYGTDENGMLHLSFYDLTSGEKTAAASLSDHGEPLALWADRWSGCLWLLQTREDVQTLLRWSIKTSPATEDGTYLGTLYTAQAPDAAGLDALQQRVEGLNEQHGIAIRIWQEAVKTPGAHTLEPEYQVGAIGAVLDQLEPLLEMFPEKFLQKCTSSKIRLCIVRSVSGGNAAVHYWDDGDSFIALPVGADIPQEILRTIGYLVDSHILGNSAMLDAWEGLNPENFVYGSEPVAAHLEGQTRAFADADSIASVSDDRARIFWQAMQPDNGEMFSSPIMQAKLLLLCRSIRDAWRLERKTETYLWEQYLTESIAYQTN